MVERHGSRRDAKNRQTTFQRLCAEIMREVRSPTTLAQAHSRYLNDPEVRDDPVLEGMVRSFLAERAGELHERLRQLQTPEQETIAWQPEPDKAAPPPPPTRVRTQAEFARHQHELEERAVQFDEEGARAAIERLRNLFRQFPAHVAAAEMQACEDDFAKFLERQHLYQQQIDALADQAALAARRGDQKTAAWTLRRLGAIHAIYPALLPEHRLEKLRDEITHGGAEHEHREAARNLIAHERAVAAEIKALASVIRRFNRIARSWPRNEEEYRRADAEYRQAVRKLSAHDVDWLAGLILELEKLLEDLPDASGQAHAHVSRFVANVRASLARLREEIKTIQLERGDANP